MNWGARHAIMNQNERACRVADKVVPQYRAPNSRFSCSSHTAKRWQAAFDGAYLAFQEGR